MDPERDTVEQVDEYVKGVFQIELIIYCALIRYTCNVATDNFALNV